MLLSFATPWPPTVNHYYGSGGRGRKFIKPEGVAFRLAVRQTAERHQLKAEPGRLTVWVEAWPPDRRLRDVDNLGKSLLDAIQYADIVQNDGLIDDLRFVRMPVLKGGMLRVFIHPFKQIESLESEIATTYKA